MIQLSQVDYLAYFKVSEKFYQRKHKNYKNINFSKYNINSFEKVIKFITKYEHIDDINNKEIKYFEKKRIKYSNPFIKNKIKKNNLSYTTKVYNVLETYIKDLEKENKQDNILLLNHFFKILLGIHYLKVGKNSFIFSKRSYRTSKNRFRKYNDGMFSATPYKNLY